MSPRTLAVITANELLARASRNARKQSSEIAARRGWDRFAAGIASVGEPVMRVFGLVLRFRRKPRMTLRPPVQWAAAALLDGHFDAVRAEFERECG